MSNMDNIIKQFQNIAADPAAYVQEYITKTDKKAIGCFYYAPQELIYAAGMLPVGLWGGNVELSAVRAYFPSFFCSVLQTTLEMGIKGAYDYLSAVIITSNCDALRTMGQNWKVAVPQVEFISLVHPQNRKTEAGVRYLTAEYQDIKTKLERISGTAITDAAINNGIKIFNKYRQTVREFIKVARDYPEIITPSVRNAVIKSGCYMDKARYTDLLSELINELKNIRVKKWDGKKIVVTGIKMDSPELLQILEENKLAVVADDLAQETRQIRSDVAENGANPLESLARYWSTMEGCALLFDPEKKRVDMLVEEVKAAGADGVLVCMTKFCDPEEFDYPIFKKRLDAEKIPHIYIENDLESENDEQSRTRVQAFMEIVNS